MKFSDAIDSQLQSNSFYNELFARGYVVSEKKISAPAFYLKGVFKNLFYAYDPRLMHILKSCKSSSLICFGIINDVRFPSQKSEEVCENLIQNLADSENSFFESLSFTCGRYVIIWENSGKLYISTDATGMKCAYYTTNTPRVIASHVGLVEWNIPNEITKQKIQMKFGFPGIETPIKNVRYLTPNTKLDIYSGLVSRYWPVKKVLTVDLDSAACKVGDYLQGAADHYSMYYTPLISVTGGLDSRVSLSLFKSLQKGRYFTYYRNDLIDTDAHDLNFAKQFSELSGCDVSIYELNKLNGAPNEFKEIQSLNTIYDHIKKLAWIYYENYSSNRDIIHVRSNISEVGREFYKAKKFNVKSGADLARLYLYGEKEYQAKYVFNIIERFNKFNEVNKILDCANLVDIKSLFYWEFRMSSWHSGVVLESDPAFETVSVYNCRSTLEALLSVSQNERLKSSIIKDIIFKKWPELSNFDVNGRRFWD